MECNRKVVPKVQLFSFSEIVLAVIWFVLCVAGLAFQMFRERKRAPFPPCPRQIQDRDSDLRGLLQAQRVNRIHTSSERKPLLRGGNNVQYGTTGPEYEEEEEEENEPKPV